jgi:hypothetical protein
MNVAAWRETHRWQMEVQMKMLEASKTVPRLMTKKGGSMNYETIY